MPNLSSQAVAATQDIFEGNCGAFHFQRSRFDVARDLQDRVDLITRNTRIGVQARPTLRDLCIQWLDRI